MKPIPSRLEALNIGRCIAGGATWLLRNISLEIAGGERVVMTGPSGSGKTLLLRSLALLDPFDEGNLMWNGTPIRSGAVPAFRSRIIYLHQRPPLLEGTVEDNLRHPFSFKVHRDKQYEPRRVAQWLEHFGRDTSFLGKASRDLSGGEAQLTALLRAIQFEPLFLLLDEPTAALDPKAAELFELFLGAWLAERPEERAFVLVSHNREQTVRLADRVIAVHDGKLAG